MNRFMLSLHTEKMAWRILIKYWYIFIPLVYLLINISVLNSSHFICKTYMNECYVKERIFLFLEFRTREIDFNTMDQFYLKYSRMPIPLLKSHNNWYGIYAKTNNNENKLIMESYHSSYEKAQKIVDKLNRQVGKDSVIIDVEF